MKDKTVEFEWTIAEIVFDNGEYVHDVKLHIGGCITDEGIGSYEFWGACGNDVNYVFNMDYVKIESHQNYELLHKWVNDNWEQIEEDVQDNAIICENDSNDVDCYDDYYETNLDAYYEDRIMGHED